MKSVDLVALGEKEMEESDNCTFELSALLSSDGNWGEMFSQMFVAIKREIPLPSP